MKLIFVFLVLAIASFSIATTFSPLGDAKDGCLYYASPDQNYIVGNPDTRIGPKSIFLYDFDFYLPKIDANFSNLRIVIKRKDGFDVLEQCYGPIGILAKINDIRSSVGSENSFLEIYPEQPLLVGTNRIYMSNVSEAPMCTTGSCEDSTRDGICIFKICGFYPTLNILTSSAPESVETNETFSVNISIVNNDVVDAGTVKIKLIDSDFNVNPQYTSQIIKSKNGAPFNQFKYMVTFVPKFYVDIETTGTPTPKMIGTVRVTFKDADGKDRIFEKNLGSVVVRPTLSVNTEQFTPKKENNTLVVYETLDIQKTEKSPDNILLLFGALMFIAIILVIGIGAFILGSKTRAK